MTKLVYLLAASHSGSTLLAMLLGAHPEVCTAGELKATALGDVDRYLCSCLEPIGRCAFWQAVGQEMGRRGFSFDVANAQTHLTNGESSYVRRLLSPLHRGRLLECCRDVALSFSSSWRRTLPRFQARNRNLVESLCDVSGKKVVVDSSKIGIRLKYLLRNTGFDVRVIRLARDGRAVALTYVDPARFADASQPRLRGGGSGGDRESERLTIEQAAREWRRSNEEAEAVLARVPAARQLEIRYETLCTQPEKTLEGIFGFIGVDPALGTLNFRGAPQHVVGNGMRLDSTGEIRLDERWREVLTLEHLAVFDRVAGDFNRRLGYR